MDRPVFSQPFPASPASYWIVAVLELLVIADE